MNFGQDKPIYKQLRERIVGMILDGVLKEGDALPSVRSVAAEYKINPLTVLKAYQMLVEEAVIEKKRGRGMYVLPGVHDTLLAGERSDFVEKEWPRVYRSIQRLQLSLEDLLAAG